MLYFVITYSMDSSQCNYHAELPIYAGRSIQTGYNTVSFTQTLLLFLLMVKPHNRFSDSYEHRKSGIRVR